MPIVIVRHLKQKIFLMMNMTEKCSTFGAVFHLHFQVLKYVKKQPQQNFAKQIL